MNKIKIFLLFVTIFIFFECNNKKQKLSMHKSYHSSIYEKGDIKNHRNVQPLNSNNNNFNDLENPNDENFNSLNTVNSEKGSSMFKSFNSLFSYPINKIKDWVYGTKSPQEKQNLLQKNVKSNSFSLSKFLNKDIGSYVGTFKKGLLLSCLAYMLRTANGAFFYKSTYETGYSTNQPTPFTLINDNTAVIIERSQFNNYVIFLNIDNGDLVGNSIEIVKENKIFNLLNLLGTVNESLILWGSQLVDKLQFIKLNSNRTVEWESTLFNANWGAFPNNYFKLLEKDDKTGFVFMAKNSNIDSQFFIAEINQFGLFPYIREYSLLNNPVINPGELIKDGLYYIGIGNSFVGFSPNIIFKKFDNTGFLQEVYALNSDVSYMAEGFRIIKFLPNNSFIVTAKIRASFSFPGFHGLIFNVDLNSKKILWATVSAACELFNSVDIFDNSIITANGRGAFTKFGFDGKLINFGAVLNRYRIGDLQRSNNNNILFSGLSRFLFENDKITFNKVRSNLSNGFPCLISAIPRSIDITDFLSIVDITNSIVRETFFHETKLGNATTRDLNVTKEIICNITVPTLAPTMEPTPSPTYPPIINLCCLPDVCEGISGKSKCEVERNGTTCCVFAKGQCSNNNECPITPQPTLSPTNQTGLCDKGCLSETSIVSINNANSMRLKFINDRGICAASNFYIELPLPCFANITKDDLDSIVNVTGCGGEVDLNSRNPKFCNDSVKFFDEPFLKIDIEFDEFSDICNDSFIFVDISVLGAIPVEGIGKFAFSGGGICDNCTIDNFFICDINSPFSNFAEDSNSNSNNLVDSSSNSDSESNSNNWNQHGHYSKIKTTEKAFNKKNKEKDDSDLALILPIALGISGGICILLICYCCLKHIINSNKRAYYPVN